MKTNESTGRDGPDRHRRTDSETNDDPEPVTDGGPDHDVPVAEQLTERQRELVGRDGGGEA